MKTELENKKQEGDDKLQKRDVFERVETGFKQGKRKTRRKGIKKR